MDAAVGKTMHTVDEIEASADAFSVMTKELDTYIKNFADVTKEKERIGAELNVATQIQADMLPRIFPPFPDRHEFDIYAEKEQEILNGERPQTFYAYYPNQYHNNENWLQLMIIFPKSGCPVFGHKEVNSGQSRVTRYSFSGCLFGKVSNTSGL